MRCPPCFRFFIVTMPLALFLAAGQADAATRTWDGEGADNNWNTDDNWSDNTKPGFGVGDIAKFDDTSTNNCTIDVNVDVAQFNIDADYTGTITQNNGVTVATARFTQEGGTFVGGNLTIDVNDEFELKGGTFTATSGTLSIEKDFNVSGGTFNHNSGTIQLDGGGSTVSIGSVALNNVIIQKGSNDLSVTGTMDVNGDLTLTSVNDIDTGTISVAGDVTSTDASVGGTGTIELDGPGAQTITASGGDFPALTVNKSSGTATLGSDVTLDTLLTVTSGTLDHGAIFKLTAEAGITIGASGTYSNTGTGDLFLGGNLANSGTVSFDAGGSGADTDDILIRSNDVVQRTWSGSGTFSMRDLDVSYMNAGSPPGSITANSSTDSGNNTNWVFSGDPLDGKLVITAAGGVTSAQAGSSLLLTIAARDSGNNLLPTYAGPYSLTWTPAGGSATTLVSVSSAGFSGGSTTASVSIGGSDAGVGSFQAVDNSTNSLSAGTLAFTWYPASFKVQAEATTLTAGKDFTLTVTAQDQNGLTVTRYSGRAVLELTYESPSSGTQELSKEVLLPSAFTNGAASESASYLDAGKVKIQAKDTTFVSGKTIQGTSGSLIFVPASFEVTLQDLPLRLTKVYVDQPFNVQVRALAQDGQTLTPNYNGTVTVSADGVTVEAKSHTFVPATDKGEFLFETTKATSSGEGTLKAAGAVAQGSSKELLKVRSAQLVINPASGAPGTLTTNAFIQDIDTGEVVSEDDSTTFTLFLESPTSGSLATATELPIEIKSGTADLEVTKPDSGAVVVSAVIQEFSMPVVSATLQWITGATRSGTGLNILQFEQKGFPMRMRHLDPSSGALGPLQLPASFDQMKDSFTQGGTRYDVGVTMGYRLVAPPEWVGRQPPPEGDESQFDFETFLQDSDVMKEVYRERRLPSWLLGQDEEELFEEEQEEQEP